MCLVVAGGNIFKGSSADGKIFSKVPIRDEGFPLFRVIRLYERYGSLDLDEILTQAKEEEKT